MSEIQQPIVVAYVLMVPCVTNTMSVFSLGPFGVGGPHVFCIQIPLMWQWVWPKFFDVNSRPHPPPTP